MLQDINTPGVEELPQGDKTFGVPTEGDGVLGEDGREWVGDGNPPTTRATESGRASSSDEGMTIRPAKEVPPSPQQCTTVDRDRAGTLHRHSNGAENARPKNGMQLRRKYGLLEPEEPTGDPAAAGTQVRGGGHGATSGVDGQGWGETETGDGTGQRALLVHGMLEDNNKDRRTP